MKGLVTMVSSLPAAVNISGPLLKLFQYTTDPDSITVIEIVISFFAVLIILFVVLPVHECAHGLMAKWLGDDTAEQQGRLTLNPFAHIDPRGAFFMLLFPVGWAKPVPVDPTKCIKLRPKAAMALIAAAGPASNIIIAYIIIVIQKVVLYSSLSGDLTNEAFSKMYYLEVALEYIVLLNLFLAVFNLLPVPPLDGSKILFFFLKTSWALKILKYQNVIVLVFYALLFLTNILSGVIGAVSDILYYALNILTGYIDIIMGR